MHDEVSILLIIIFILGCVIIYLWQHRGVSNEELDDTLNDTIERISRTLEKSRKEAEKEFYNNYIKTLLDINSDDYVKASEAWLRVISLIEDHLPFFKTGYMTTLIFEDSRYLDIVNNVPEDISDTFKELEDSLDSDLVDVEKLADQSLLIIKWFNKYKFKDPTK